MTRIPRKLAGVGAADIPDASAFDAYVGPSREVTVDPQRGVIALHDGSTPGGVRFTPGGAGAGGLPPAPGGRISLTSGVALPAADVVGATTIYYIPCAGGTVPVFNGTEMHAVDMGAGLSLPLDVSSGHAGYHQVGRNFDLFAVVVGGVLRLGTGPSWNSGSGSDVARGTGAGSTELQLKNGFWTNKNAISVRIGAASGDVLAVAANQATYLGSFRATADGQATDAERARLVYNAYNQAIRRVAVTDVGTSHSYATQTFRIFNNDNANKIDVLFGLAGGSASLQALNLVTNSTATVRIPTNGVGLDGASAILSTGLQKAISSVANETVQAICDASIGMGYHFLAWLERGAGADAQTWYSSTSGLFGSVVI